MPRAPAPDDAPLAGWLVYMLECADGTYYVGVTNDLWRRLAAHDAGRGARYTRGRGPVRPVFVEPVGDKGAALSLEHALKRLSRPGKERLAGVR